MKVSTASQWLDRDWMKGRRYGHFVQAMDHYRSDRPWADFYNTAYQPLHPVDDLSIRIEAAQRHLQWLLVTFRKPLATDTTRRTVELDWLRRTP